MTELKFDLLDITIMPCAVSNIKSRNEIDILKEFNHSNYFTLPLITAPMDTVISLDNIEDYINVGIIPCLPRTNKNSLYNNQRFEYFKKQSFKSFGLHEIESDLNYLIDNDTHCSAGHIPFYEYPNILIDIANGHMQKLIDILKLIKKSFPNIVVMVGNIANPLTYKNLAMAGADYVRIGIGGGAGCTTSANVAINYPMGSLITECRKIKIAGGYWNCNIVADGGMKGYADIIKALGLGADYVMVGSLFNKSVESTGFNYLYGIKFKSNKLAKYLWEKGFPVKKKYRGMSTKSVQKSWGKQKLITAEGVTRFHKIEYTLSQWTKNFRDYLKSAMSYSDSKKLDNFIGYAEYVNITTNALKRFDK